MFLERPLMSRPQPAMHSHLESPLESQFRLPPGVQAKLAVGAVDDPQEREADQVAEQVVQRQVVAGGAEPPPEESPVMRLIRRKCAACEGEERAQRKATGSLIQRTGDFEVDQLPADADVRRGTIYFTRGSSAIPASEQSKITEKVTELNALPVAQQQLELVGMASEEGPHAQNDAMAQARAQAVQQAIVAAGYTGTLTIRPVTGEQANRGDYANTRCVEMLAPGATSRAGDARRVVDCNVRHPGFTASFDAQLSNAQGQIRTAVTGLNAMITALGQNQAPDQNHLGLMQKYFASASLSTITTLRNLLDDPGGTDDLMNQLDIYRNSTNHRCLDACPGATATNWNVGTAAMLTICPNFMNPSRPAREGLRTLIHEGAHGTPSINSMDIGYRFSRMIPEITTVNALQNSDSIALFVQEMNGLRPLQFGRDHADTFSGFTGANAAGETRDVQTALAFIELYVVRDRQLVNQFYTQYRSSQSTGNTPVMGAVPDQSMHTNFGVVVHAPLPAGESETLKIAAILDRISRMETAVRRTRIVAGNSEDVPLNITRGGVSSVTAWSAGTDSAGTDITIGDDFVAAGTPIQKLQVLLRALVAATPGISAARVPSYVNLIEDFRQDDGLPDPAIR